MKARAAALLVLSLALCAGARGQAAPAACPGSTVTVHGASTIDAADLCEGARLAIAFLSAHGLSEPAAFAIEATARLPEEVGRSAAGCFLQERNRAYVLPYAEFRRKKSWFGVPISRALYRAVATHETAHAVAACHFRAVQPSIQAKEYIAYVAMFATMPAALRSRALASMPGEGFDEIERVSAFVYLFDPMQFGANAYRHFARQADGSALLRDVLDGRVLAD